MPNALAMREATASVGLARLRSTWLNIERLTPEALASTSSDQPRSSRNSFKRQPRWLAAESARVAALDALGLLFAEGGLVAILEMFE
jgi:hypothetical protein